jgi:CheY-like chemotaxis protein
MTEVEKPVNLPVQTVFIADDDADDQLFFRDALSAVYPSIKLEAVQDGTELLALLSHLRPDLIFLDLDMPGLNGLQTMQQIRNNTLHASLPIVVFSSTSRASNIDTAYEMGADLFFIKPPSFGELKSAIKAMLQLDWTDASKIKQQYFINGRFVPFM